MDTGTMPTGARALSDVEDRTNGDLVIRDLTVAYQQKVVLRGVNVRITPGQVIGIIGPNGGGKSTLLKAILGLVPIVRGSVTLFGHPSVAMRSRIAYVPQREMVDWDFPVTVWDVVMMGRYPHVGWLRRPGAPDTAFVADVLRQVGMWELRHMQIGQLSGGSSGPGLVAGPGRRRPPPRRAVQRDRRTDQGDSDDHQAGARRARSSCSPGVRISVRRLRLPLLSEPADGLLRTDAGDVHGRDFGRDIRRSRDHAGAGRGCRDRRAAACVRLSTPRPASPR
jgi:hypothetical protein